jgi:2-methylisocitrate lyase-like PEP mutase family enzyme
MLEDRCDLLRSLHVPGSPLVLPNAWDAASARAVVEAGFPVVATTSGGVAAALGYEDHQDAPVEEMLGAAARIVRSVDAPVTLDAEAGYGLSPGELVEALWAAGVAGCNLEDTDHSGGTLIEPARQAEWLASVRQAADDLGYPLVLNARIDVFLAGRGTVPQTNLLEDAVARGRAYLDAGVDCVYPIFLSGDGVIEAFVREVGGAVNILASPNAPPFARLAEVGVARISYGSMLHHRAMAEVTASLAEIARASGRT